MDIGKHSKMTKNIYDYINIVKDKSIKIKIKCLIEQNNNVAFNSMKNTK